MSVWVRNDERDWFKRLVGNIVQKGPIPRHVGFIMDGNRRYALKAEVSKIEGHMRGFDKLTETLRWCLDIGIQEVTAYVFSIENFKRPPEEVNSLMTLAKEKFTQLLTEEKKLMEEGVCVQIVGDWSLVPSDLKPLMAKVMILTRYNTRAKLNVAFAYTSRNEMSRGVIDLEEGVLRGELEMNDLNENIFNQSLSLLPTLPLDLLLRTSGETRLSDFLLYQSTKSVLCFTQVLWPEFTYWQFIGAIFKFQLNYIAILQVDRKELVIRFDPEKEERTSRFIQNLRNRKWEILENDANTNS